MTVDDDTHVKISVTCATGAVSLILPMTEIDQFAERAVLLQRRLVSERITRDVIVNQIEHLMLDVSNTAMPVHGSELTFSETMNTGIVVMSLALFMGRNEMSDIALDTLRAGNDLRISLQDNSAVIEYRIADIMEKKMFELSHEHFFYALN